MYKAAFFIIGFILGYALRDFIFFKRNPWAKPMKNPGKPSWYEDT